ncbi:hypothetical protein [Pseudarthrobacter sp. PS3-L1]|nr:hypothetical protein [Pseudarthrobacter sp. PS3-L1]MDJ0322114.1 hypothetical protein [Pseudarthrobacter sp. PS3-L1]
MSTFSFGCVLVLCIVLVCSFAVVVSAAAYLFYSWAFARRLLGVSRG